MIQIKGGKGNRKVLKAMAECLVECVREFKSGVIEELSKIAVVMEVFIPVFLMWVGAGVIQTILLSCICLGVVRYVKAVSYKLNKTNEKGMPVPTERYTRMDADGFIELKDDNQYPEMLQYIYELEMYMVKKGMVK